MIGDERAEFFVSGGTLPPDSESYIERAADRSLLDHLLAGHYCYVLNARQMGKSSLSVRTMAKLEESGVHSVFIDLTQIGSRNVQIVQWYAGLTDEVAQSLELVKEVRAYTREKAELSPMQRFFGALHDVVLPNTDSPIVIFVDEIDATRNLPFDTDEFFAGIRECYNRRVRVDSFKRLTFCLIGVAVPNDLIRNPVTTPFNIGERIRVEDFNLQEVLGFAPQLGSGGPELARRVHHWTNGQPLLTQSICHEIVEEHIRTVEEVDAAVARLFFDRQAITTHANLSDVANRVLNDVEPADAEKFRADILTTYERALRSVAIRDDEANRVSVVLKLSGLMRPEGDHLVVRNRIYRHVFDRKWIEENLPGQELVRQRQSFRRGLVRGVAITAVACAVVGTLGLFALRARSRALVAETRAKDSERKAIEAQNRLDYELYVSQMNSLRFLDETGNQARAAAILDRWKNSPHRDFEWGYWFGRLHDSPEEYTLDYAGPGKTETGIISEDGKQICIDDPVASAIVLFDRQTKKVLGATKQGYFGGNPSDRIVVATDKGIVTIHPNEGPAQVTQLATGKELLHIGDPGLAVGGLGYRSRTNTVLLSEGVNNRPETWTSAIWDLNRGLAVYRLPHANTVGGQNLVSKDCRRFLCWTLRPAQDSPNGAKNQELAIWDRTADRAVDRFPFSPRYATACISESGRLFAYWDENHVVKVRDVDAHRIIYSSLDAREELPVSIQISPDDQSVVTVSSYGVATIRDIRTGRRLAVRSHLTSLIPGEDGLPWVENSSSVRIMDRSQSGDGIVGHGTSVHRDGRGGFRIATADDPTIDQISDPALTPKPTLHLPPGCQDLTYNGLWCLQLGKGSSAIVSVDGSSPPKRYGFDFNNMASGVQGDVFMVAAPGNQYFGLSKSTGKTLWRRVFNPPLRSFWFSPDGQRLVCATDNGKLGTMDPLTGKILRQSQAHNLSISAIGFSADGRRIVTGGGDGVAYMWDTDTLQKLVEFHGNESQAMNGADISPDGRRVATCSATGAWQLWNAETGDLLMEIQASILPLRSILFSSDGRSLVTAGDDGLVRGWKTLDKDPTVRIPIPRSILENTDK